MVIGQEQFACEVSYYNMKMDNKRMVMFEKGCGHFKVFNRQTMELECVSTVKCVIQIYLFSSFFKLLATFY